MGKIADNFEKSMKEMLSLPQIYCLKCGSVCIDYNFIDEIRCYDCGNNMKVEPHKFFIVKVDKGEDYSKKRVEKYEERFGSDAYKQIMNK